MNWKVEAEKWRNFPSLDRELQEQIHTLTEEELEDAFYKNLEFGTGGMRGEIGVGTNRINVYTIRKATAGLAEFISTKGNEAKERGVVIAFDSRHKSQQFAMEAARTLATKGIQAYVFDELRPTPELSFAVRFLQAYAGIVITASHNPPEYNGYKVYGPDGGQLTPIYADEVIKKVNEITNELLIPVEDEETLKNAGLIKIIGEEIDQAYLDQLMSISENSLGEKDHVRIVFTPLHGTANKLVRRGLAALGYQNVYVVKEQELSDPEFSTVKSPNPEEHAAFELAIRYGEKHVADLLIATDPDADRLGIAVKNEAGEYTVLTGNQTGAILLHYLLSEKKRKKTLPRNGVLLKTIVTSELGKEIAVSYGIDTVDVLTGFKFIAEKIEEYERSGSRHFIFGYEESYGYLIRDFTRDKDAVQAALLAAEVCAYYKRKGMSLYDALLSLYEKYGYYQESLRSLTLKGKAGTELIKKTLSSFREKRMEEVAGLKITQTEDYLMSQRKTEGGTEAIDLPKSNVLKYFLEDDSWICLRPSGTEPKIKFYFGVRGKSQQESKTKLEKIEESFMKTIQEKMESIKRHGS